MIMPFPIDFVNLMQQQLGPEQARQLLDGLSQEPSVSVRLNRAKLSLLSDNSFQLPSDAEPVAWCPEGFYLSNRPSFTFDPLFHAGLYYVQEAGSMYLDEVLRRYMPAGDLVALDLCAAPGGKSTLLRGRLSADSLLVSNEPMRPRAQVLAENIIKWGHPNCVVTNNFPEDFRHLEAAFDLIVVDAPCSGEGMFRKDEVAVSEWSLQNVETCVQRQRKILADIWPCLKPGGLLVYSTCTFNRYEDEENTVWIARELGATELEQRHFFPGRDRGEGFYLSALRKDGEFASAGPCAAKNAILSGLNGPFELHKRAEKQFALPVIHAAFMKKLLRTLNVLTAGVEYQEQKGRDWIPAHGLSMSRAYVRGTFPEVEVDYPQAISYLRRDTVRVDAPRGIVLLTYRGVPLGFAKSVGGRLNNMYPQEWRIRTTYLPSEEVNLLM
ncbi:MAG: rRNA cytosine-C5-methyltransferase [Bacteroidaceae bacterium]|nr:rRNA cytosine-C5-methyltransferase [Bacteroidaceae bacterium]